jgi:hypothetical protein
MVKAHSLLYAIYICLIVSLVCGSMLYYANLYGQLNTFYNLQEEMYIQNQSLVNYALGNNVIQQEYPINEDSGIQGNYVSKEYGLISLLLAKSSLKSDTISSAHFIGSYNSDKTAIYLANFSRGLSYSGSVKIVGDTKLPVLNIQTSYINNKPNNLINQGKTSISNILLPNINSKFKKVFEGINAQKSSIGELEKQSDSLFYNSFFNETKEINVPSTVSNIIFKGNFILRSKDSIRVKKNAILEDVILIAPKITFEEGFSGTLQAFSTNGIELEQKVSLNYPSVVCLYNNTPNESLIRIKKGCKITGAVVLFGNQLENIEKNIIEVQKEGLIFGSIYCSGKLDLKSKVYGTIYTNRFFLKTESSTYDNTIEDIEINTLKLPKSFISIPLFDPKKTDYGILKKVL